ncbi:MarR family transcriptional regulator [Jatrophihabitans telluris]|uniref:MarR family transcriptional regulator n=1 Tax=Jatrophihabitans telluris TaxID=2038343 RepID=A0ABY4QXI7_9ACTN|nr:MarR family transcriptional regulator [Jatrophihabitans telluris]UQX87615.1 MarR family transcriptional regulator [Jatrophihabitans telluris]
MTVDETFVLEQQLCFALHDASRAMTAAYRPRLARIGLTYTQYALLLLLWEHGDVAFKDLSTAMHMDSATLSPLLRRMAEAGLVERLREPGGDERTVTVRLTKAGAALYKPARAVQAEVEVATGLARQHLEDLRQQLHDLAAQLREPVEPI